MISARSEAPDRSEMTTSAALMLGALVVATDGVCGIVKSLLVDPSMPRVEHLVVEPEQRIGLARLVPAGLVQEVEEDARYGIDLSCDIAAFEALALAETSELIRGVSTNYVYVGGRAPLIREVHELVPENERPVQEGTPVTGSDGPIGVVAGLVTDLEEHTVVQVLASAGHHWWHHRVVALPVRSVVSWDRGVEVNLTVDEAFGLTSSDEAGGSPRV
jgi:hypothetical protein